MFSCNIFAGKPDPVSQCRIETVPHLPITSVNIVCLRGWDGGLPQTFLLVVQCLNDPQCSNMNLTLSSEIPVFFLKHLTMGMEYVLTITAINARHSSIPVTLTYAPKSSSSVSLMKNEYFLEGDTWVFSSLLIAMIAITIILITIVTLIIKTKYCSNENKSMTIPIRGSTSNSSFYDQSKYQFLTLFSMCKWTSKIPIYIHVRYL